MLVDTNDKSSFGLSSLFPFNSNSPSSSPLPQQINHQIQHRLQEFSPPLQLSKRESSCSTTSSNTSTLTKSTINSNSRRKGNNGNTPEAVYNSVKKPFNYAEGFHYLIQYVTDRYDNLIINCFSFSNPFPVVWQDKI